MMASIELHDGQRDVMDTGSVRERVAPLWEAILADWRPGAAHLSIPPLRRWHDSYVGRGDGAVDLAHYPDPFIGDLRGVGAEPRLGFLGLNPAIGTTTCRVITEHWPDVYDVSGRVLRAQPGRGSRDVEGTAPEGKGVLAEHRAVRTPVAQ